MTGSAARPGRKGVLTRHAYALLSCALLPLVMWRVVTGNWVGDFWEHAAVIGEMAARPFGPLHPMLALAAPHSLESPYHLALAGISALTGLSAVDTLALAAPANFVLLVLGLHAFVRLFSRRPLAPFFALLFTLLLWGPNAWDWSGFFHLSSFSVVMPYPSTLATACAFFALWTTRAHLLTGGARWLIATVLLVSLVTLTHPPTAAFYFVGAIAIAVGRARRRHIRRYVATTGGLLVAVVAAIAWPYYPIVGLPGSDPAGYLRDNDQLLALAGVFQRVAPALLAIPLLAWRFLHRRRDPLVLIFVGAGLVYLVSRLGGGGSLATTIRFVVLSLHVALAVAIAGWVGSRPRLGRSLGPAIVAVAVIGLLAAAATPSGRHTAGLDPDAIPDLEFLGEAVPDDAVIMTDAVTALEVPAWGPKVIAWHYAMPFVTDRDARRTAVADFFDGSTSADQRRAILERYCAGWILIVPERLVWASAGEILTAESASVVVGGVGARVTLVRTPVPEGCVGPGNLSSP